MNFTNRIRHLALKKWIEPVFIALWAVLLLTMGVYPIYQKFLIRIVSLEFVVERSLILKHALIIYGAILGGVSLISFFLLLKKGRGLFAFFLDGGHSLIQETVDTLKWFRIFWGGYSSLMWLGVIMGIGIFVRGYFLSVPMRYDEAYTFLRFVNQNILYLFLYPAPNNHVLHTLLVKVSVFLFGNYPVAIRLPAFLSGLFVIPATFGLSRVFTNSHRTGYIAAGLVVVHPYLILYDTMARGYSLMVLLSVCLALLSFRFVEKISLSMCFLMALLVALGLFTIPSFAFPATGIFTWLIFVLWRKGMSFTKIFRQLLGPCGMMAAGMTVFLYTPVILVSNGIHPITSNYYVRSLPWHEFFTRFPIHLWDTLSIFEREIPQIIVLVSLGFLILGLAQLSKKDNTNAFYFVPLLIFGGLLLVILKHTIPYERTWIYLLPFIFVLIDAGVFFLLNKYQERLILGAFVVLFSFVAIYWMAQNIISRYPKDQFVEAPVIVEILSQKMRPGDEIVVNSPIDLPVEFYMWYLGVPSLPVSDTAARTFYIVKPSLQPIEELASDDILKLFRIDDAELYVSLK